jgi:hypothetical protein
MAIPNMWVWLNATIKQFEKCFSRKTAFNWFVIITLGLMLRTDHLGITSIVREFSLTVSAYPAMIHFFRSESWYIGSIKYAWIKVVASMPVLIKEDGRYILIGDGVKQPKEGRKTPGVKKLHQESDNSSKGEYIHGHLFGGLGILAGCGTKLYSILLSVRLHEGIAALQKWRNEDDCDEESHIVKMVRDAAWAVQYLGKSILLLDRLFLSKSMLSVLAETPALCVVTKAKFNTTAYYPPGPYKGRGARPKKGPDVKIADLFYTEKFTSAVINLYGKDQAVGFSCINLLWGRGLYQNLKFVLTVFEDGTKSILVSTDLTLSPESIIRLYCRRFKIECAFRELKQVVAGFSYHFWSKVMPKLQKFKSNDENQASLENVFDLNHRRLICSAVDAIECYVQISVIALGLLQLIGLLFGKELTRGGGRYMRTVSNEIPSERTVADFMRKNIYILFSFFPDMALTLIIKERQTTRFGNQDYKTV